MNILIVTNSSNDIKSSRERLNKEFNAKGIDSNILEFTDNIFSFKLYKNLQNVWLAPLNFIKYLICIIIYRPKNVHTFKFIPNLFGFLASPFYSWYAHVYGLGFLAKKAGINTIVLRCYVHMLRQATTVYVQNNADNIALQKYGCDSVVIPGSGIEERELSLRCQNRFIMVGRPVKEKGFNLGIEAFCLLSERSKEDLFLEIFGVEESDIEKVFFDNRKLSQFNITFKGNVGSKEEIYMSGGTLLFLSSYAEGFPRVVLEAWSFGLYVIALRNRGIVDHEEIMSEGLTLLSDKIYPKELAQVLYEPIKYDASRIQKLAQEFYSYKNVADRVLTCM